MMSKSPAFNWQQLRDAVTDALELPLEQRAEFLRGRINADATLLAEALQLVEAYERTDGVLHPSADAWLGLDGVDLLSLGGQRIGRYRLERLVSEGATAAVYLATQTNPQRSVAIKLVRHNLPLTDGAARFMREADALGRLQHPNVARIYEAGVHRPGVGAESSSALPFIAMEYVDGPPVTQYAEDKGLSRTQRIALMIKIANAVHSAHQRAIIHRDIKPANVLVDSAGEPKVLDFGIAHIGGGEDATALTLQTAAGVLLGTPSYMSPEQAAGNVGEIDVRSDVWSLGVMLYELLTGRVPIDVRTQSLTTALRTLESAEPQPISRHDPSLRGDIEVVVMTALSREKERRYASAQALADDLQRVLSYEPIAARQPSAWYRLSRFARRHRIGLAVAGGFLTVCILAGVLVTEAFLRASRERDKTRAVNQFLSSLIDVVDPQSGDRSLTMLEALKAAEGRLGALRSPAVEADVRSSLGWMYFGLGEYDRAHAQLTGALERRLQIGEADSPTALQDQARLATTLRWQYRPQEARALAEGARVVARNKLGDAHPTTLTLREVLAGCDADERDYPAAEAQYRAILADCRRHLGDEHEQTLTTAGSLANVLFDQGRYAESESITRQVLQIRKQQGSDRTVAALTLRENLATCAAELGRAGEAIRELRAVVADAVEALGEGHWLVGNIRGNLATHLENAGATDEAASLLKLQMDQRVAQHGWTNDLALDSALAYSALLLRSGRFEQAQALCEQANASAGLDASRDWYHRLALNRAAALAGRKRFAEAIALYRGGIEHLRSRFSPQHQLTLVAESNFGQCLVESGDYGAAIRLLEPLLARVEEGRFTSIEPSVQRHLGHALLRAGRLDEAQPRLLAAHAGSAARGDRRSARLAAELLAELFERKSDQVKAGEWRRAATE